MATATPDRTENAAKRAALLRDTLGPIEANVAYPLETFKRKSGLRDWALKTARRNGLRVRTCGNRRYIIGADWLAYLSTLES